MQENRGIDMQGKKPMHWNPDHIDWQEFSDDGTRYALLEGIKDEPGALFTYAFFVPAGFWDAPHWHTTDARIVVVAGALQLGYGEMLDQTQSQRFGIGSYLLVPAHAPHFDGADVDTIIIGTASGPWATIYVHG